MAEAKVSLPDDLLSSKSPEDSWTGKDDAPAGNDDEKWLMGFLDDSKDQVTSESSIPLSPQWLYAKPNESKPGLPAAPGDIRAPTPLTHGNSLDPVQKEGWRLDGSLEKKEWRRNAPDIDSSRRWREEERETGLLGRRDRRKEGDRENEYRKSDRRTDTSSIRETAENRPLPSSDRWHDVTSRNPGHETRRDSKWSSRWGPEDKEKVSRNDKRVDVEKEDAHSEKQTFISSNRAVSERESDSRDKWRPRHRQEAHSVGPTVYRAAPGFGLERGRLEGSNVGFAPGRGRSNIVGNISLGRPSFSGPIGAAPVERNELGRGKSVISADTFCYPRGKLLDIYRKQKLYLSFNNIPDGLEEVPPITISGSVEPLAFVAPGAEEEAILKDIGKGKLISSGAFYNSSKEKIVRDNENETGVGDAILTQHKHGKLPTSNAEEAGDSFAATAGDDNIYENGAGLLDGYALKKKLIDENDSDIKEHETEVTAPTDEMSSVGSTPLVFKGNDLVSIMEKCGTQLSAEYKVCKTGMVNGDGQVDDSISLRLPKTEDVASAAAFDVHAKLPDDSNSLFDLPTLQDIPSNEQYVKNSERATPPEELSLFYQDPQGEMQGPFLGVDIISWFEQGFFGTDLPVCLSDAPEGTPFQELGDVMPHLKYKDQTASGINNDTIPELSDTIGCNLKSCSPTRGFADSTSTNDLWTLPDFRGPSDHNVRPGNYKNEDLLEAHRGRLGPSALATNENEEILFPDRPGSSSGNPLGKPASNLHDSAGNPASRQLLANELGEPMMLNHKSLTDSINDNVQPLGLLWSELEGAHLKRSNLSGTLSGVGDQAPPINTAVGRDGHLFSHKQNSFAASTDSAVAGEIWSDSGRRNALAHQSVLQGAMDPRLVAHMEQHPDQFDLQFLSQQLQKQLLQQNLVSNHPPSHLNGSVLEQLQSSAVPHSLNPIHQQSVSPPMSDLDHFFKLQQQRQFELQVQQRLQQQQFELEEQHRLQQQQFELEEQHRLQQQQFELEEQHRLQQQQFELEEQHRLQLQQFELEEQHRLQQQELHHRIQLQQQSQAQQLLLEQFLHHQMHDPGFMQSQIDPLRSNNMLDQILLRQHLLHESQQQSHLPRHRDPLEQLIHAKFGQNLHPEHHNDLLELLHAKHGQMLPLDQQFLGIQHEQLKARQFSAASRQQLGLEDERHLGGAWSVDGRGQFVRGSANPHQMQSSGVDLLDFFQRQQRPSSFEQPSNLERNLTLHDRRHLGLYESSSLPPEMPVSLPAGASEMNMDFVNAMARVRGRDMQERNAQAHSASPVGSFSSGLLSHSPQIPNQFHESHLDGMVSSWPEREGLHPNDIESRMHQLHLEAERKKRDSEMNLFLEDPNSWASAMPNDGNSTRVFMDMFHKKAGLPLDQTLELDEGNPTSHYDNREPSWLVSASPSDKPYNILAGQASLGDSFAEGPRGPNLGLVVAEHANNTENSERFLYRSNSGAFMEDERSLQGINETAQAIYGDTNLTDKSVDRVDFTEVKEGKKGKKRGSKSKVVSKPIAEAQGSGVEPVEVDVTDCGDLSVKSSIKHASLGSSGGSGAAYNYDTGVDNAYGDKNKMDKNWTSTVINEFDNSLLKRPPVSRVLSSQEALSELASAPTVKGKIPTNFAASEGRDGGNPSIQMSEAVVPSKKDGRFRRTSSCSDADVSEPSFIDMLKSTKKPAPETDATIGFSEQDANHGGKGGKKKGKKGRQIDPALLGFKVSSNRIMMGEIQRLDD
ncbi:hypothetical protein AAC387_Pa08g2354 [Persea americana]